MAAVERFETLWAQYVEALEAYEAAYARTDGHARRVRRGARKRAERLHARLAREYDMDLGCAP